MELTLINLLLSLAAALGGIGAAISAYLSWRSVSQERKIRSDQILSSKAVQCLERAWNALTVNGTETAPPPANRLNWLTAARLILEFHNTKARITDKAFKELCEAEEFHWRLMFSRSLESIAINMKYFSEGADQRNKIYPKSAIILHQFAEWPEGKRDPLDDLGRLEIESFEYLGLSRKWASLRHWLEQH